MSILDSMTGLFSQQGGLQSALATVFDKSGGLQGVLDKLNASGYGERVNSWLGNGPNAPITAAEIQSALGNDHLKQIAASMGLPLDQVATALAQHLPGTVDAASPGGALQSS